MSAAEDFSAAHETWAVFDLPERTVVEFRGGDRARFLHNFCTNDINRLEVDRGCEAIFTNIKARAVGHGFVFAGAEAHWLDTTRSGLDDLLMHLDKYLITDDVEIDDRSSTIREIFVTGPKAPEHIATVFDTAPLESLTQTTCGEVVLRRVDLWNEPGVLVSGDAAALEATVDRIGTPGDPAAAEALRLEAGFPQYGTDISEDHMAPEVCRISQSISYNKGCYLGQEPIARIDALGHVNRGLRAVVISGAEPPQAGACLAAGDGTEAGTISSAAASPVGDQCYALAWLGREHFEAGTQLKLAGRDLVVQ